MRIALCISGKLRNSLFCFPTIYRNFILNYNTDVFMHVWEYNQQVFDVYQPTQLLIENENEVLSNTKSKLRLAHNIKINPYSNMDNNILMYYGIEKCISMVDSKYDAIIRLRPDLYFTNIIELTNIIDDLKNKKYDLQIPNIRYNHTGINDQIAIGNYHNMKLYSKVFSNINNIVNSTKYWHPESILTSHINNLNIKVNQMDYEYGLVRGVDVEFSKHTIINYKNI